MMFTLWLPPSYPSFYHPRLMRPNAFPAQAQHSFYRAATGMLCIFKSTSNFIAKFSSTLARALSRTRRKPNHAAWADVAFTQELLSHLSDNLCLDSNCFHARHLFAAFAPVSPALYAGANPTNCAPGRPVPIVNFHGLSDRIIPFGGQNADKEGRTEYAGLGYSRES
ncbi:hypothetical protein C8F01DRAFT_1372213 [Mycena amicta]|nr:hypothetical protein C8F01DRAFT_1372213 [Mycena amicta]